MFISTITILQIGISFIYTIFHNHSLKIEGYLSIHQNNLSWKSIRSFILILIHPNLLFQPFVITSDFKVPVEEFSIPLNLFFSIFQTTLCLIILSKNYCLFKSKIDEKKLYYIRLHNQNKNIYIFLYKYIYRTNPFIIFSTLLPVSALMCSLWLRAFEGCILKFDEFSLTFWINSIWTTFHTMLSTGYANVYPETYFGKFIGFVTGVVGYINFSIIIIIFVEFLDFRGLRKQIYLNFEI